MWTTGGCYDNRACFCVMGGQLSLRCWGEREGWGRKRKEARGKWMKRSAWENAAWMWWQEVKKKKPSIPQKENLTHAILLCLELHHVMQFLTATHPHRFRLGPVWHCDTGPSGWEFKAAPCHLNRSQLSNLPATATLLKQSENQTRQTVAPRHPQASTPDAAHTGPSVHIHYSCTLQGHRYEWGEAFPGQSSSCLSCPASLLQAKHTVVLPLAQAEWPSPSPPSPH